MSGGDLRGRLVVRDLRGEIMRIGGLVSVIFGAILGILLASIGYGIDTWQFWAILGCALGMMFAQIIDD